MPTRNQLRLQWMCDTGIAHYSIFGFSSQNSTFSYAPKEALLQDPVVKSLVHLFDNSAQNSFRNTFAIDQKTILCTGGTRDAFYGDSYANFILRVNTETDKLDTVYQFPPTYRIRYGNFFFQDALRGFFFGEPDSTRKCRFIVYTTNGGNSWTVVDRPESLPYSILEAEWTYEGRNNYYNPFPDELFGLKNGSGYLMRQITTDIHEGSKRRVFQWTDYGKHWKEMILPIHFKPISFSAKDINQLVLLSRHDYWQMFISKDAGNTWDSIPLPMPPGEIIWVDTNRNNRSSPFLLICKRENADSLLNVQISFNEGETWYRIDEGLMKVGDLFFHGQGIDFFFMDSENLILSYYSHDATYRHFLFDYDKARALSFPRIKEPLYLCLGDSVDYNMDLGAPVYWSFEPDGRDTFQLGMPLFFKPSGDTSIYLFTHYHSDTLNILFREDFPDGAIEEKYFTCMDSALILDVSRFESKGFVWSNGQSGAYFSSRYPGKYSLSIEEDYYCSKRVDFEIANYPRYVNLFDTGMCFDDWPVGSVTFQNDLNQVEWLAPLDPAELPVFYHPQKEHLILPDTNGCPADLYFDIINQCPPEIYLPNAFHPQGPIQENQVFKPVTRYVEGYEMEIYNRWGQLIYKGDEQDGGWDGRFNGEIVGSGVYFYFMSYTYTQGIVREKRSLEGRICLIN